MGDFHLTSDEDIQYLITCEKRFTAPPKRPVYSDRDITQRFEVYSKEIDLKFNVFIAYSARLPQDFSIGLMYNGFLLLRCNGYHGTTRIGYYNNTNHHAYPHAHLLTMRDIESGRGKKPSNIEDMSGNYMNLLTAEAYFFNRCNILDAEKYFDIAQLSLF